MLPNARPISQAELLLCARMIAGRIGWAGFVGLLLIVAWGLVEFVWLPQQQEKPNAAKRAAARYAMRSSASTPMANAISRRRPALKRCSPPSRHVGSCRRN